MPSDPFPYQRIMGKYSGDCIAKFICSIYVVSIIYDSIKVQQHARLGSAHVI